RRRRKQKSTCAPPRSGQAPPERSLSPADRLRCVVAVRWAARSCRRLPALSPDLRDSADGSACPFGGPLAGGRSPELPRPDGVVPERFGEVAPSALGEAQISRR